ncbi:MAG: domain containing protein [Bryobacterales bacterium]|nr:domain containing protein [Bryobacterales bacterium]
MKLLFLSGLFVCSFAGAAPLPVILSKASRVQSESIPLKGLDKKHQYSVLYSLTSLVPAATAEIEIRQGADLLAAKTLHAGDADFYAQFRVLRPGDARIVVKAPATTAKYTLQVNQWPLSGQVKSAPSHRWQDATPIPLGKTVFASGDDAEYVPLPATSRKAIVDDPNTTDWYRFDFSEDRPKLIFFQVDLMERDQVPVNVAVYRVTDGKLAEFYEGEDPVTLPHEVQALPGNKFTPRILKDKGVYYVSVHASHPEYKFRTRVYEAPPYTDPHQAVRTGVDYILAAGDSWHANTPRRGGVLDRVSSVHQETSLCVGCHATHFPQRAQLYATRNGYPVVQRQQLQFLSERFYNNPRPFYGFEEQGATWARMISAPANVLGRMSHLMDLFEDQVTGESRASFHQGIAEYLKLYYAGRDKLPADETNGNTPLVSAHEVAWYAWTATKDSRMGDMIVKGEVKNMIDLCYQTQALVEIDREKYKEQVARNAARILSLQRPSGQWSARFEANQPEVEFQTGHALWALHAAGIPIENPQVAKAIGYLMKRQQPFGGWMDPLQSFENFRTPFRETQMSVLALSSYYPQTGRAKGWNSPKIEALSADPVETLEQLDNVWDAPSDAVRKQIVEAAKSNDALVRQAALEALGRLGVRETVVAGSLGDASKMVQRTAAWALRQEYSRHPETPSGDIVSALGSASDRTRWGATRVFAQHFSALAKRSDFAAPLAHLVSDPAISVRMQAIKGLWQFWFWSADVPAKSMIEDTVIQAMAKPQAPWIERNLRDAVYNFADENIRYLYNNWVPLLARQEDRDRAIQGRLAVEARLACKFATVLEAGSDSQKKALLRALNEFPLRRGDIYDLEADLTTTAPPIYSRIGNDIEQIAFFGDSAERMARAISPLLDSSDPELRRLGAESAMLVRDTRFGGVNRLAGPTGSDVKTISLKLEKMPEGVEVLRALKPPPPPSITRTAGGEPVVKVKLDEAFFRGYVEPILEKRGKDGYACVHCHASHTLFNGTYGTALNVVDAANPENSLILRKPTSTSESEGVANSATLAHGGGVRFAKDSPEYATILQWIKGAKE